MSATFFIKCLYRTVIDVNYLFHTEPTRNYLLTPPPSCRLNGGPITETLQ